MDGQVGVTTGWQEHGIDQLVGRVNDLDETLDELLGQLPDIIDAVARVDTEVTRLHSERSETGSALSRHDRELRELTAAVKRLTSQVSWIEGHLRSTGSARSVTLDGAEPDLATLAAAAEAGRRAAGQLLTRLVRVSLESTVASHREAMARRDQAATEVLAACAVLIDTEPDQPLHRQARSSYQRARHAFLAAQQQVAEGQEQAQAAEVRLADDDVARERTRQTIADGQQAQSRLLTRLRTRVAAAVGDGAMLPVWVTDPLGPAPPADGAQRWMDVAAGLIAYRVTYRVQDDQDALGELPQACADHRRRWYEELRSGIRELRR